MLAKVTLSVDDCHCIVPVFPVNVKATGLVPEQIVCDADAVPATDVGLTVTVAVDAVADGDVDEAELARDGHGRLGPLFCEGEEPRPATATENERQHLRHGRLLVERVCGG